MQMANCDQDGTGTLDGFTLLFAAIGTGKSAVLVIWDMDIKVAFAVSGIVCGLFVAVTHSGQSRA